jgi:DNA polymerase-3 subunit epsilon
MLNLGCRCALGQACQEHGIVIPSAHMAACDALAAAELLNKYYSYMQKMGVQTFSDLALLRAYKFCDSFCFPLVNASEFIGTSRRAVTKSRYFKQETPKSFQPKQTETGVLAYWDALKGALSDLTITDTELKNLKQKKEQYGITDPEIKALHAKAFMSILSEFSSDCIIDGQEEEVLKRLYNCLRQLGWAPGE